MPIMSICTLSAYFWVIGRGNTGREHGEVSTLIHRRRRRTWGFRPLPPFGMMSRGFVHQAGVSGVACPKTYLQDDEIGNDYFGQGSGSFVGSG